MKFPTNVSKTLQKWQMFHQDLEPHRAMINLHGIQTRMPAVSQFPTKSDGFTTDSDNCHQMQALTGCSCILITCPHWCFSGNKRNWGPNCQCHFQCPVSWSMFSHVRPPEKHTGSTTLCLRTQHYINHSESRVPQNPVGLHLQPFSPLNLPFSRGILHYP